MLLTLVFENAEAPVLGRKYRSAAPSEDAHHMVTELLPLYRNIDKLGAPQDGVVGSFKNTAIGQEDVGMKLPFCQVAFGDL